MTEVQDLDNRGQWIEASFMWAPVGLLTLDLSAVRERLDRLSERERCNMPQYVTDHPGFLNGVLEGAEVLAVNHAAAKLLDAPSLDLLIGPLSKLVRPGSEDAVVASLSALATRRGVFQAQLNLESLAGRLFRALIAFRIPEDSAGFSRVPAALSDLSKQLELEEQLRVAQRMEAVGRLAGGIAHDFNNLLTIISNYAVFLREALSDRVELKEDVDAILDASCRAGRLTRQLLAFGSLQVAEVSVVDINQVLREMESLIRSMLSEDVRLSFFLDTKLSLVEVDPRHIEHIIVTLACNARDAMPTGGKLVLSTRNIELDRRCSPLWGSAELVGDRYVVLSVRDSGLGMDDDTKAHIFEPFFTTKPPGQGTGLGLSSVYGMVKQAHGFIRVQSELGAGAQFEIYLPQNRVREEASAGLSPKAELSTPGSTQVIILVEDHVPLRNAARRILESAGHQVYAATDCAHALRLCQTHTSEISAIVTDVVMPDMSGPDLVGRALVICPSVKVLYMSGYAQNVLGPDPSRHAFIAKPFTPQQLLAKVRAIFAASD